MFNIGSGELLIILLVALIFLGPERLPGVARQLGQTVSSLRSLASGFQAELQAAAKPDEPSMTLAGPTPQDEAIAATQTDPDAIAKAARQVSFDEDDEDAATPDVSAGGPTDLRESGDEARSDEEE